MTENFCYNQNGINYILKQFGDAISNKQYKNPIPYIIKISKLYGSRFIIITSKRAPAITLEYKDAEAAYEDLMRQLCNLHT